MILSKAIAKMIRVGPILDEDGLPYVTATIAYTAFLLSKNGAAGENPHDTTGAVQDGNQGMYRLSLDATDTGTLGTLDVSLELASYAMSPWRAEVEAVVYTSKLPGINNDLATDDAAIINAAIAALSTAGGGELVWDGRHAFFSRLIPRSRVRIRAIDRTERMRYFGASGGGTDDFCIANANLIRGYPVRGTAYKDIANPEIDPVTLESLGDYPLAATASIADDDLTITMTAGHAEILGALLVAYPAGYYLTITQPLGPAFGFSEDVLVTSAGETSLTVTRAQRGSTAKAFDSGALLTPTILDEDITIENLTINCQGHTFLAPMDAAYGSIGGWKFGLFLLGVRGIKLDKVTLIDPPTFGFMVGNWTGECHLTDCHVYYERYFTGSGNDSFHFWGPFDTLLVEDCVGSNNDNVIGVNWGETHLDGTVLHPYRSAGDAGSATVINCTLRVDATGTYAPVSLLGTSNTRLDRFDFIDSGCIGGFHSPLIWEQASVLDHGVDQSYSVIGTINIQNASHSASGVAWLITFSPSTQVDSLVVDNYNAGTDTANASRVVTVGIGGTIGSVQMSRISGHTALIASSGTIRQLGLSQIAGPKTVTGTAPTATYDFDVLALDEQTSAHATAGTVGKAIADTLADTNEVQSDWTNGGRLDILLKAIPAGVWAALTSSLTTVGSIGKWLLDNMLLKTVWTDAKAGYLDTPISGTAGTGAYTITVTVTDGTDPLEGAKVRFTKGAESSLITTNVSGQASVGLDAGTWTVAATLAGYSFTPTTLVVTASAAVSYAMTAVTIPASDPTLVTGYWYCYDESGVLEEGAIVQMRVKSYSGHGAAYDLQIRSETSDAAGLATFTNLQPGAVYQARRGENSDWTDITVPTTATSPYALPDILGEE